MKISIDRNSLLNTLSHVQNVVERRNTVPILSNILIDAKSNNIVLSATDMDLSITETIVCSVIEEGSITTAALTLFEIVRKTPEGSEIELISNDGSKLSVRSGKSKFSLSCLPKDEFPIIDTQSSGNKLTVKSQVILNLINKTKFAISNEETRYFLNGLYLNIYEKDSKSEVTIVGTDGHRLAKSSHLLNQKVEQVTGVIIPKKTINELSKLLSDIDQDIEIIISSNKIIFYINNLVFVSKLIDGTFPDYKRVIPNDNKNILKINRDKLLSAVDRVSTIANEKSPVIKFKLLQNILNLNTINTESSTASEDLDIIYEGDEIEIGFNSKYIMDIVNNLEDEIITLKLKDGSSPITAQEKSNSDLVYVLMPMRV